MPKMILLVHGRNFKPPKNELRKLWIEALRHGIERDHPGKLTDFGNTEVELVYFGDISHDQKVAGDFRAMKKLGYVNSIRDKRVYNLAVRDGKSNPHHGVGYLIHPTVADAIAAWL